MEFVIKQTSNRVEPVVSNHASGASDPTRTIPISIPITITSPAKFNIKDLLEQSRLKRLEDAKHAKPERSAEQIFTGAKLSLAASLRKVDGDQDGLRGQLSSKTATASIDDLRTKNDARLPAHSNGEATPTVSDIPFVSLPEAKRSDEHEPDDSQLAAIEGLAEEQYGCLIGAAGTGKTFTLKKLLKRIEGDIPTVVIEHEKEDGTVEKRHRLSIRFLAFTGRAVQQMKRQLDANLHQYAGTIHGEKGLAFVPEYYDVVEENIAKTKMRFVPTFNSYNRMPAAYYNFDESGMLAVDLWNKCWAAMPKGARVFFIGDINQLPPVYGRSILGFAMDKWPTFELTTVHRQALDNPIIFNAHQILKGLQLKNFPGQFRLNDIKTDSGTQAQIMFLNQIKQMHKAKLFDPFRDAIIVGYNIGYTGQDMLNSILAPYFNPDLGRDGDGVTGKRISIQTGISRVAYAVGDKVMLTSNDKQSGLTNGQTGRIVNININGMYRNSDAVISQLDLEKMKTIEIDHGTIDFSKLTKDSDNGVNNPAEEEAKPEDESSSQRQSSHIVTVNFDGKEFTFNTAGQFRRLSMAYVITCHKSQGGEYPTVIILCHSSQHRLLSREWFYTAVTRAQQRVLVVYNSKGIMGALNTQRIKGRTLEEKIKSFIESSKAIPGLENQNESLIPVLPDRRKVERYASHI